MPSDIRGLGSFRSKLPHQPPTLSSPELERRREAKLASFANQKSLSIEEPPGGGVQALSLPQAANNSNTLASSHIIKPVFKRYLILFLFAINAGNKSFQWIQIPASTNKVTLYYDVSNYVINTSSVIFMLAFVVLSLPSCYIIEIIGIRKAVLIGSFGTALGAIVKLFCCHEDGIWMLFIGQLLVSFSEQFIFSVPSRLASVWFPDSQVSSAVSLSVLGNHLGVAIGFVVPQFVLDGAETKDEIGAQLYVMFWGTAVLSVAAFVADYLLFDEAPPYAPGAARLNQIEKEREAAGRRALVATTQGELFRDQMRDLWCQLGLLFSDRHFNLLAMSFGINVGINYAIHTVLNQMLEPVWPGDEIIVGWSGFIIVVAGVALSAPIGAILDSYHKYKLTNLWLTLGGAVSILVFGFTVQYLHSRVAVYLAAALVGIFQTGLVVAGLELAVELTYPAPELLTSSMMNVMPQIYGTVFVYAASYIMDNHGVVATNSFYAACFGVAFVALLFCRETLNRQREVREETLRNQANQFNNNNNTPGLDTNKHKSHHLDLY